MANASHVYQVFIRTTPERLWQAITDGELTKRYFYGTRFEGELVRGSLYRYWMDDGTIAVEGHIVEIDPPRRLVMTWQFQYDPELKAEEPSRVTWEIEQHGPTCLLRATHDLLGPKTEEHVTGGWPFIVSNLKSLLETGEPLALA